MALIEDIDNVREAGVCCPRCEAGNLRQHKFCAKCGTALWEPCLGCGALCAAGERYCGTCGASLDDAATELIERIDADYCTATEMASAFRFEEAIALLTRIVQNEHPRLAERVTEAREFMGRLAAVRQRQRVSAEEARQKALRCLAACDYDGAAELIESIPLPLQDEELRELRAKVAKQRREIAAVEEDLRDVVHQNRLLELPPYIERLLALKPDHAYARSVAAGVQKGLVAAARKMLEEHRYDQAMELLNQISVWSDASNFQQIYRQAAELACLAWDLRNAPVVDNTLVVIADRLRRMAPGDGPTIRLCDELQRRSRLADAGQPRPPLPWARPPKQMPLGVPIEWLSGFRRVVCSEAFDQSELTRRPGRYAIACGLALAGIRQAVLRINLLSEGQRGVLHRVKNFMQPQIVRSAWGIDLGMSSLKAVKLAWNQAKQQAAIESAVLIEHPKILSQAANEGEESRLIAETLKTFLTGRQLKGERLCLGLPGRMTLSRNVNLPPVEPAKAAKLLQFEAPRHFPFPLEQLAWDFQILNEASLGVGSVPESAGENSRRALMIAARRTTAQRFLDVFRSLDMEVDILQTDYVALHNFLAYDYLGAPGDLPPGESHPVVAAVDIGCDVTNLVVGSPRSPWFHSCGMAGHSLSRALVREYNLTLAQAEERKRNPESVECFSDLYEILSPLFGELLKELQESLAAYTESQPDCPIQGIVGLGGGFLMHGLFRYLRCGR
jgi:type IV pilus assembly protein PilM